MLVTSIQSINEALVQGKLADMIGVEGEHAINSNLAILRTLYRSGAKYLNLAQKCTTPWIDSSEVEVGEFLPGAYGLSELGENGIVEMDRIGMMIDLSRMLTQQP